MTVPNTTSAVSYVGTGTTPIYPYSFQIAAATDLVVYTWLPATGAITLLSYLTNYTVDGVGIQTGGSVTLLAGNLAVGTTLFIATDPAEIQSLLLQQGAAFNPADLMNALDLLTREVQATRRVANNSIQIPLVESLAGLTTTLPAAAQRALKTLTFDALGNPAASGPVTGASVSSVMIPVVTAATTPIALTQLGAPQSVANIAALRLVTQPVLNGALYKTDGYYTQNDGGDSFYIWNSASVAADDGFLVIKITAVVTGRFTLLTNGVYSVQQAGAKGDGATDDLAPINLAITAANAAGGGVVTFLAKTYVHSAAITMKPKVICQGVGRQSTILLSSHVGDGVAIASPINSSTAVNTRFEHIKIKNTNAANAGGGYVDVGGTFVVVHDVCLEGFKYGVIFDQTELAEIDLCDFESPLRGGVWLVNGAQHSPGASTQFTNRISISRCQFNSAVAATFAIIDDGGYVHSVRETNFNGFATHVRLAGCFGFKIEMCEFESCTSDIMQTTNTAQSDGAGVGQSINIDVLANVFVPVAGQKCINITNGSPFVVIGNYFGNSAAVKIDGVVNVSNFTESGNFNAGGGATVNGTPVSGISVGQNGMQLGAGIGLAGYFKTALTGTNALNFGAPGAVPGQTDLTITVTGAALGDTVYLGLGATVPVNYTVTAFVSAVNTVTVRLHQYAGAATGQNLGTCRADVWKH